MCGICMLVSNPHREASNVEELKRLVEVWGVSNPHREASNPYISCPAATKWRFPTLIGRLVTTRLADDLGGIAEFPTLIGRLVTKC